MDKIKTPIPGFDALTHDEQIKARIAVGRAVIKDIRVWGFLVVQIVIFFAVLRYIFPFRTEARFYFCLAYIAGAFILSKYITGRVSRENMVAYLAKQHPR